ncbi:MAG TPA: hypothetical protein VFB60_22375 [Ktedonobacteraceae bacterium]|nr:hypothetical protein [Ktedonobacteraceae bacterium]
MGKVTPEHIQNILINPFYVIQVAPELVETHAPSMRDEEWVRDNSSMIQKTGAEPWLTTLLDVLQGNTSHELVNPYYAINIDPIFAVEHPPMWPKDQWIQGNVTLLSQLGIEQWLQLLLDVLEGDFVTADDMGLAAPPGPERIRYRFSKQGRKKRKKHKR